MQKQFDLRRIDELDPGLGEAIHQAFMRCLADCEDRPGNKSPRKINLMVELVPRVDETGAFDEVELDFKVTDKAPDRKSKTHKMKFRKRTVDGRSVPQLVFNEFSEDPHENELPFGES